MKQTKIRAHIFPLLLLCLLFFLITSFTIIPGITCAQPDEVHVFIDGPSELSTNTTVEYTVKITGGPAEENATAANWSFSARLEGEDGDAKGGSIEPMDNYSKNNTFKINLRASSNAQTLTLIVNGSSATNDTNSAWSGEVIQEIEVFEPIPANISAIIRNPTQFDVQWAVVSFYLDGTHIGNQTVDVPANSTELVYMEWIFSKKEVGEHTIEIRINEDLNLLEFESGDNIKTMVIYVGDRPDREQMPIMVFNSGLVFVIEVIAFFFFLGAFLMRRNTLRGRGYYSPASTKVMYFEGVLVIVLSVPVFYVSQIMAANPDDISGDSVGRLIEAVFIFIMGFLTILMNWDRTRRKKR
jgi:hypothetical protein